MRGVSKWLAGAWCVWTVAGAVSGARGQAVSGGAASQPGAGLYAELYLRDAKAGPVRGTLVRSTDGDVTIKTVKGETTLLWTEVTGSSAYMLRSRLIDKTSAKAWLNLGTFAWGVNARDEARTAFDRAAALDRTCRAQADAVLRTAAGALLKPVVVPGAADDTGVGQALTGGPAAHGTSPGGTQPGELYGDVKAVDFGTPTNFVAFGASTPGQEAAVMAATRKLYGQIAARLKFKGGEYPTNHFVVFTELAPEKDFIAKAAEDAYAAVAKRFDLGADESLFLGKIPLFVLAKREQFLSVAQNEDNMAIPDDLPGYFAGGADGHLTMGPPTGRGGDEERSRKVWTHVLAREMTHAFLARWRSNRPLPPWFERGVAEVVASDELNNGAREAAVAVAAKHPSIQPLFADAAPEGEWFPVMQTLAEMLVARDGKAFVNMAKAMKDGTLAAEALKGHYKMDYTALEKAWREAIKK